MIFAACGRLGVLLALASGPTLHAQSVYSPAFYITTVTGAVQQGDFDATGPNARFRSTRGIALDGAGNIYLADNGSSVIRKVSFYGVVTTLAGQPQMLGSADGTGPAARFRQPRGIAADAAGNVYVADSGNNNIRKVTPAGMVSTFAGSPTGAGGNADGAGPAARFLFPTGLAIDGAGNLYVADNNNNRIRRISPAGVVTTLRSSTGAILIVSNSLGLAVDGAGNLYASENSTHLIKKITPSGDVSILAGSVEGSADGPGPAARFRNPTGVAVDPSGYVYVADTGNVLVRRIAPDGTVTTVAGRVALGGGIDGLGDAARFNDPHAVAADPRGNLYVADGSMVRTSVVVPVIDPHPVGQVVAPGANVTLTSGTAPSNVPVAYQWRKDGADIPGATTPTLALANLQAASLGRYTLVATNVAGASTSNAADVTFPVSIAGRLINLSLLTTIPAAGESFTLGYVVGGAGTAGAKPLVIRAAGPSLAALGVGGTLDDPRIELFAGAARAGENDNWGGATTISAAMASVGAFAFTGPASLDAATVASIVSPDNSVRVSAAGNGTGTVIAEIYDATPTNAFTAATPRLVNVSVLKHLGAGLTAGFVVGGAQPRTVLIRAVGPTLGAAPFNVAGVVADPQLVLFGAGATRIADNDNWGGTAALTAAFSAVGAFALPAASRDAALVATLQPGSYTVEVSGVGGTTGVAIVEVYEVP